MNKQKALWNKLAKSNSKYYIASFKGKGITEEEFDESGNKDFIKYISDDEILMGKLFLNNTTILEIGCGTGRMTEYMAWYFKKVIGIDISGEMIRQAKERLKGKNNIEFIETDGQTIPLSNNSIDFAFSYLVFQHFKTKEMIEANFKEVYRVLKSGCLFKVLVRTDEIKSMSSWWSGVKYDYDLVAKIGFKILKSENVNNYGLWLWLQK